MIKHKMTPWVLAASLGLSAGFAWSENSPIEQSGTIQNEMNSDATPSEIQQANASVEQRRAYWKGVSEDSLKHYNRTLKTHGPSSDLTKDAQDRHNAAEKAFKASQTSLGETGLDERNPGEADKQISAK